MSEHEADTGSANRASRQHSGVGQHSHSKTAIELATMQPEVRNAIMGLASMLDRLEAKFDDHERRLIRGDEVLRSVRELNEVSKRHEHVLTVMGTRFAIIWAGLGVSFGAAATSLTMTAVKILALAQVAAPLAQATGTGH